MATITPAQKWAAKGVSRTTWSNLLKSTDDVGRAEEAGHLSDKTVQMIGTLGTAGAITVKGSLDDGTTWATLNDPQGDPLVLTALGMYAVQENVTQIRPEVTAGDGATDLSLILLARSQI